MILFSPMWQHEIERLGWRRCSPAGYVLLNVSDGLSWLALILWIAGLAWFDWPWGWPAWLVWLLGRACYGVSMWLWLRRRFVYEAQTLSVSWQNQSGELCRYSWADHLQDEGAS